MSIKEIQSKIGATPDGEWGPKSKALCKKHLHDLMPSPSPWPSDDTLSMTRFYGEAGERHLINLDVAEFGVKYDGQHVKTIRCNKNVADSLLRIIEALANSEFAYMLQRFDGCYNFRKMRGGNSLSIHSWGSAIDFDAGNNSNNQAWPESATMPFGVMEIFAREGWLSAGAFWGRDAMHFQATK